MKGKTAEVRTGMSVQDCGAAFQVAVSQGRGLRSHMGGFVSKVTGNDQSGFFTPTDNSPFSALDADKPTFMVGCNIPKLTNSAQGNATSIHMYVWDRGTHRDVQFFSPHGMLGGGASSKIVNKVLARFREADPKLAVA
jgi:hypothetical protein